MLQFIIITFSYPIKESSEVGTNEVWGNYAENKYLSERVIIEGEAKEKYKYTIFRPFYETVSSFV